MTRKQFELFLLQSLRAKGKSLDKVKDFFKIDDEIKLKKEIMRVLKNL